jgi:hypothetical protein
MADSTTTRLTPLPFDEWDDETKTVLLRYLRRPEIYLSGRPDAKPMPKVLGLFARHLRLTETWLAFSETFATDQSTLDPMLRELAVLRVAWRSRSAYEWNQHIRIGSHAGLTTEQLYAVPAGAGPGRGRRDHGPDADPGRDVAGPRRSVRRGSAPRTLFRDRELPLPGSGHQQQRFAG